VAPLSGDTTRPVANADDLARDRWREVLTGRTGVIDYALDRTTLGPVQERPTEIAMAKGVTPVDLTIEWESLDAATALFGDSALLEYLCGAVAIAPSIHVQGDPQDQATPA
jgi:hypothetical protein